jgi:hypothetical protein
LTDSKIIKRINKNNSWDGMLNGLSFPLQIIGFVVTRSNGKEYRGHFGLK